MNDTITHYIMYLVTFFYFGYMTVYIFKNITKQQDAMMGLIFSVDVFRYTSMFLSFMLTMYFGTEWGVSIMNSRPMDAVETVIFFSLVVMGAGFVSAGISSLLLYAERVLAGGGLSTNQFYTVGAIYLFAASIDFMSLSIGGGLIAKSFELEGIEKIEKKQDVQSAFVIRAKQGIAEDLQSELVAIKQEMRAVNTEPVTSTRRVRTLSATLARCEKKHKPCPDTNAELASIVKAQHSVMMYRLQKQRKEVQGKLMRVTDSYESTATRLNAEKSSAIAGVESDTRDLQWWIDFGALMLVLGNLFFAFGRAVLSNTVEVKEEESGELTEDEIRDAYLLAGMKAYATTDETELSAEDVNNETMTLNLPRDPVMVLAKKLSKGKLKIGGNKARQAITRLQGAGMPFRIWLRGQVWNNLYVESA